MVGRNFRKLNTVHILFLAILVLSCNTFTERGIVDNQDELKEIVDIALRNNLLKYVRGDEGTEGLRWKLQKHQIDEFEIRYRGDKQSTTVTELDSIAVFTRKGDMLRNWEYIVYDLAKRPRKVGTVTNDLAAYEQAMVGDRWYFVTVGFD